MFPTPPKNKSSSQRAKPKPFRFSEVWLFLIETIYYLATLIYLPSTHSPHIARRVCLCICGLIFAFWFANITNSIKKKVYYQYPSFLLLNFLFLLNEASFLEGLSLGLMSQNHKELLIIDLTLETIWRFFILHQFAAGSFVKIIHTILCGKLLFSLVMPSLFTLSFVRFTCEGLLFCLPAFFAEKYGVAEMTINGMGRKEQEKKIKDSDTVLKFFRCLPEGVFVANSLGQIKFMNNYFKNIFDGQAELTLKELSQYLPSFEFSEASIQTNSNYIFTYNMVTKFRQNYSTSTSDEMLNNDDKLNYRAKLQNVTCLEDLFALLMKEKEVLRVAENYVPTFQAKYYQAETKDWKSIEIKAQIFSELDEEKYLIVLIRDTTERESKIISLEKEKITLRDNLLASFSHELRTPLNSNLAFLEQGIDNPNISQETKEKYLKPALVSGRMLFFIISDILDYSLMISNELHLIIKPKSLVHTVNTCFELLHTKMNEKNIAFGLSVIGEMPDLIYTDHSRVSQILINLLNNALQYTMKGRIDVVISRLTGQKIEIAVQDTGIGMDLLSQQRLRAKLSKDKISEKVNENSTGMGLGLFVSNKLSMALNGRDEKGLVFTSKKGFGSKFSFEVIDQRFCRHQSSSPLVLPKIDFQATEEQLKLESSLDTIIREYDTRMLKNIFRSNSMGLKYGSANRVLIVDDEIFNIVVIENFCKSLGIATEKAFNGQEALDKLRACSNDGLAPIKMVFMDVNMPIMDGYQATSHIKEMISQGEIEDLEIVGVTAYVAKDKIVKGFKSGMSEIVNKPLSKAVLSDVLKRYTII